MSHFCRMQLDVLTRATHRKEQELNTIERNSLFIPHPVVRTAKTSLPTLPVELLLQIFSRLHWAETARNFEETTLNRLIEDGGTADRWKHFIRRCIPVAIVTTRAFDMVSWRESHNIVGHHPRVIRIQQLGEDSQNVLKNKSTVVFASLLDIEEMERIRRFSWHNLILSTDAVPDTFLMKIMRVFLQKFGANLMELDHVDFSRSSESIPDPSLPGLDRKAGKLSRVETPEIPIATGNAADAPSLPL
ncbi:hypothetical protein SCHPADRAFT_938674 [Schizopora paradoxa]|uniref:Uncharacterized protein n=1 Tax=Schizopora paradoxa TaxID=27342 RepID=A0A0H2S121_9AGAM|nr:hypothetical protein SCHPADRAFT_938674 [Schizopora paradoxa]